MPHIIVEYSSSIKDFVEIPEVLEKLHASLSSQEGVDIARVKARGIKIKNAVVGTKGAGGHMVHTTVLLLEGRSDDVKKKYGQDLFDILNKEIKTHFPECAITLEVRDMSKATYFA